MTDIGLMVRSANPVPDESQALTDDELSAVLLLAQQRSGGMDTKERTPAVAAPRRRGWTVAAMTFAAVLLVLGVSWILTRGSNTSPPATTPTTTQAPITTVAATPTTTAGAEAPTIDAGPTEEVMRSAVDAILASASAGDAEELAVLIGTAEARLRLHRGGLSGSTDLEGAERQLALERAMQTRFEAGECALGESETRIECSVVATEAIRRALDLGGLEMLLKADIDETGQVTWIFWEWDIDAKQHFDSGDWATDLEPFIAWLDENHPGDLQTMIPQGGSFSEPSSSPESTALWAERVHEYMLAAGDPLAIITAYENAANSGDREAVLVYLDDGFEFTSDGTRWDIATPEQWAHERAYWAREGAVLALDSCEGDGSTVTCVERLAGPFQAAVYGRDWTDRIVVTVEDGKIARIVSSGGSGWPTLQNRDFVRDSIREWVAETDPGLVERITPDSGSFWARFDDLELAPLWLGLVEDWLEAGRP